jgi:hypothetical protein
MGTPFFYASKTLFLLLCFILPPMGGWAPLFNASELFFDLPPVVELARRKKNRK